MKQEVLIGQTDYSVLVKIRDTAGAPATGLTEADIDIAYARVETDNDVTTTDVTPAALTALTDAHTDWGFEEVSATDHPGLYRLDIADAVFASGAWSAVVTVTGTGLDPADMEFVLIAFNPRDGVRLGLTALPNAAADAAGGLPISDAGGLDLDAKVGALTFTVANKLDANVTHISGDSNAADNAELFFDGTGYKDIDNVFTIRSATAQTATGVGTEIKLDASASASDDFYNNTYIQILSGTGASQARFITDYVGATKVATVDRAWTTNPTDDSVFAIFPFGSLPGASAPTASEVADAVWDEARSGHVAAGSFGEYALADAIKISGDATAVDNLETVFTTISTAQHLGVIDAGTAQAVDATSITLQSGLSAPDDALIGATVHIRSSTNGIRQTRQIIDWVNATKVATVDAWNQTPTGTITYVLFATGPASSTSPVPVDVKKWSGTNVATPDTSGYPIVTIKDGTGQGELSITTGVVDANAVQLSSDATAADNAEAFFDGTGYAGTGNVIPTVTTVTNGVDVAQISGDSTAADNLEAVLDGTGGVTLVATAITLTTPITANSTQISGDATAADNLEAALDGTGGVTISAALTGNVTGNLSGSVGSVTGNVGGNVVGSVASVVGNVGGNLGGNVTGSVGSLAAQAKADVNAEALDVLVTDTFAQPSAVPAATSSLKDKLNWLFTLGRNKVTQTADTQTLRNDADDGSIATSTHADDGSSHTRGEWS